MSKNDLRPTSKQEQEDKVIIRQIAQQSSEESRHRHSQRRGRLSTKGASNQKHGAQEELREAPYAQILSIRVYLRVTSPYVIGNLVAQQQPKSKYQAVPGIIRRRRPVPVQSVVLVCFNPSLSR